MKQFDIKEHFSTPDGYFDNLTEQIMAQLPEQPSLRQPVRRHRLMPYVAACLGVFVVLSFAATMYFFSEAHKDVAEQNEQVFTTDDDDIYTVDEAAHYTMIDNSKLHYIITEF